MSSWQSKILKLLYRIIRAHASSKRFNLIITRNKLDKIADYLKPYPTVNVVPTSFDGIAAEWLLPKKNSEHAPIIFYLHGGGYILGSASTHRYFLSRLAHLLNTKVIAINYRLAPECPFPASLEDAVRSYIALKKETHDQIVMMGDSAGGALVISTLLYLRDNQMQLPDKVVCFSPWINLAAPTLNAEHQEPLLTSELINYAASLYLKNVAANHPQASPFYADLTHLPPVLIQVGTSEIFYKDIVEFSEKLRNCGNEVELQVWQDLPHCWQLFLNLVPEANEAILNVKAFIGEK